jgi:hypothetical protein
MGKDHIRLQFLTILPFIAGFLRAGEDGQPRISSVSLTRSCSSKAMATIARGLKRPQSARRHPSLLAKAVKGAVKLADLPAAKRQLAARRWRRR